MPIGMSIEEARRVQQENRNRRNERRKDDPARVDPSKADKPKLCKCGGTPMPAEDGLPIRCLACGKRKSWA